MKTHFLHLTLSPLGDVKGLDGRIGLHVREYMEEDGHFSHVYPDQSECVYRIATEILEKIMVRVRDKHVVLTGVQEPENFDGCENARTVLIDNRDYMLFRVDSIYTEQAGSMIKEIIKIHGNILRLTTIGVTAQVPEIGGLLTGEMLCTHYLKDQILGGLKFKVNAGDDFGAIPVPCEPETGKLVGYVFLPVEIERPFTVPTASDRARAFPGKFQVRVDGKFKVAYYIDANPRCVIKLDGENTYFHNKDPRLSDDVRLLN